MPPFAKQTFRSWYRERKRGEGSGQRVMLWPDTFNNYFRPQTAIAATQVLEALGYRGGDPAQAARAAAGRSTTGAASIRPRSCGGRRSTR